MHKEESLIREIAETLSGSDQKLPKLRMDLDFQPSPSEEQPGLLIRDPFRYSDTTLIIPKYLLRFLPYFDGQHTSEQLIHEVEHCAGRDNAVRLEAHLRETLDNAGFLHGKRFEQLKEQAFDTFRNSEIRTPSHAGAAYPADATELREYFDSHLQAFRKNVAEDVHKDAPLGVAAPHISFEGGWQSYAEAVQALEKTDPESLFVILGTSHYGEPNKIGITTKAFTTPLGTTKPEPGLVESLAEDCADAVTLEDYCHAVDHSIEFHVLLLQYAVKPEVRVVPILVGSFLDAMQHETQPRECPRMQQVFKALRELAAREGRKIVWLMSIDMAHMGRRYGDAFQAIAHEGEMAEVRKLDEARIAMLQQGRADAFWKDVNQRDGELKWCGSSTLYTFTQIYPEAKATLLSYEQWNIDPESTVSFGTLEFRS